MFTINDISFWILIYGIEILIGEFIIVRQRIKKKPITARQLSDITLIIVIVIATQLSLISYTGLFLLQTQTDFCMADEISKIPINGTRVHDCVSKGSDMQFQFFSITLIVTVISLFAQIWQITQSKKSVTDNKQKS